jgi:dissimilatory sulfite reductase (desulfoviridin) alpha/beta subunit
MFAHCDYVDCAVGFESSLWYRGHQTAVAIERENDSCSQRSGLYCNAACYAGAIIADLNTLCVHVCLCIACISHCSVQVSASSHDAVKELTSMLILRGALTAATAGTMVQLWSSRTMPQLLSAMTALIESSLLSKQDKQRVTFLRTVFANHLH